MLTLLAESGVLGIVRGREVRVDRIDPQMAAGRDLGQRPIDVVVPEAEAIHAGVDLEMAAERHPMPRRRSFERAGR